MSNNFYDPSKLLSYNADVNLLVIKRGIGKTYFCKSFCINDFLKTHGQFIIAKQLDAQIQIVKSTFFDDYKKSGDFKQFVNNSKIVGNKIIYTPTPTSLSETAGFFLSLNTATNSKGFNVPFAKNLLFDEFIPDINKTYLNNEDILFSSIISTIFRRTEHAKIFMTANNISVDSPYFRMFQISLKEENGFCFRKFETLDDNGNKVIHKVVCQFKDTDKNITAESQRSLAGWISSLTDYGKSSVNEEFYLDDTKSIISRNDIKCPMFANFNLWSNGVLMTIYKSKRNSIYFCGIPNEESKKIDTFVYEDFAKASEENCHLLTKKSGVRLLILNLYFNNSIAFENQHLKNTFLDLLDKIK